MRALRTIVLIGVFLSRFSFGSVIPVPDLAGSPVVDEAGALNPQDRARIEAYLLKVQSTGKAQMALYLPKSLDGHVIEEVSMAAAEKWKLGTKGTDLGAILVVALRERQMRLEVGYGLEGILTDAFSRRVLDEVLRPYFREGRIADGILAGFEVIAQKLGSDQTATIDSRLVAGGLGRSIKKRIPVSIVVILVFFFILFSFLDRNFSGYRHRRGIGGGGSRGWGGGGWSSGGGGFGGGGFGGGFGGGGGGFGGGGASSRW